ncbi:hypothetical protein AaE_005997 [Aphanomyces astaci]|uniref:ubiquitinyl hydrolase 1 n=1 Tax=Aphanomyces astaci TaxID=112090 RepID=A0A6A5A6F2_APHAT|nr:hypothetical protein AaE_005997 [Aphanomyces astaci]
MHCGVDLSPQPRKYIRSVVPRDLNCMLSEDTSMFRGMHQQDAEEGFQFIMEKLEKEINQSRPDTCSLSTLLPARAPFTADGTSAPIHPFYGLTGNLLECNVCQKAKPISTDYFLDLKLSLCPFMDGQRPFGTLRESLLHYTSQERIEGPFDCYGVECSHCTLVRYVEDLDRKLDTLATTSTPVDLCGDKNDDGRHRSSSNFSVYDLYCRTQLRGTYTCASRIHNVRELKELTDMLAKRVEQSRSSGVCDIDLDDPHCWTPDQRVVWETNGVTDPLDIARTHATFLRHVELVRPPRVLLFHINRNVYVSDTIVKLDVHLAFDDRLRLTAPLVRHCEPITYALVAVVVHHGNERGGHYTCYRRVTSSHWVHISDEHVVDVSVADVRRAKAYMLLYEMMSL